MTPKLSITLNIDSSADPELTTAVTAFLTALQSAGHLEAEVSSGPSYDETDFVVFEDVVEYLSRLDLKSPREKAVRVWWSLNHDKFQNVNPHILIVCNKCLHTTKDCKCGYSVQQIAGVKIGVQSLLSPQRIIFKGFSPVSKERLQSFIGDLRRSRRDYPRNS